MYRNMHAIGLLIAVLTAFVVVDATSALAQKKPMTVQITVTEDAVTELENWPQDVTVFTSARTPIKSLTDFKESGRVGGFGFGPNAATWPLPECIRSHQEHGAGA
jgi:hypothetical protein